MSECVLLIEDDARIREIVERGLRMRGFAVLSAGDGASGLRLACRQPVDVVLLDLVLPDHHGLTVLKTLRTLKAHLPVIALTALDDVRHRVNGLDAGVDDYVTKPFSIDELAARIRARLRVHDERATVLSAGGLTLDLVSHRASLDGRTIPLAAREVSLLATFLRHPGEVLSREELLRLVWEIDFDPGSNVVDVYVAALRRKLGSRMIETVRGVGYRLRAPTARAA
jgi:two-component system copper resistance phosphate regulon response regulator CusR